MSQEDVGEFHEQYKQQADHRPTPLRTRANLSKDRFHDVGNNEDHKLPVANAMVHSFANLKLG